MTRRLNHGDHFNQNCLADGFDDRTSEYFCLRARLTQEAMRRAKDMTMPMETADFAFYVGTMTGWELSTATLDKLAYSILKDAYDTLDGLQEMEGHYQGDQTDGPAPQGHQQSTSDLDDGPGDNDSDELPAGGGKAAAPFTEPFTEAPAGAYTPSQQEADENAWQAYMEKGRTGEPFTPEEALDFSRLFAAINDAAAAAPDAMPEADSQGF